MFNVVGVSEAAQAYGSALAVGLRDTTLHASLTSTQGRPRGFAKPLHMVVRSLALYWLDSLGCAGDDPANVDGTLRAVVDQSRSLLKQHRDTVSFMQSDHNLLLAYLCILTGDEQAMCDVAELILGRNKPAGGGNSIDWCDNMARLLSLSILRRRDELAAHFAAMGRAVPMKAYAWPTQSCLDTLVAGDSAAFRKGITKAVSRYDGWAERSRALTAGSNGVRTLDVRKGIVNFYWPWVEASLIVLFDRLHGDRIFVASPWFPNCDAG